MRLKRALYQFWPWRWFRSARALAGGVRLHLGAVLVGDSKRFHFGRGTVVGERVRVDAGDVGRVTTGNDVWLSADVEIQTDTDVRIGAGTTVQRRCTINGTSRIGRGCILAPNVFISSGAHPFRLFPHLPIRQQEQRLAEQKDRAEFADRPVWIQDDCWLGVNVVIGQGVIVGKGSIVGANSVVTGDVAPYTVVAGAPARLIGERLAWKPPATIHADRDEDLIYILSGMQVREVATGMKSVLVMEHEPLQVAIDPSARRIRVYYSVSATADIRAVNSTYHVKSGEGFIELDLRGMPTRHDALMLDLSLQPAADNARFYVRRIVRMEDRSD